MGDVRGKGRRAARVAVADETTTIEEKKKKKWRNLQRRRRQKRNQTQTTITSKKDCSVWSEVALDRLRRIYSPQIRLKVKTKESRKSLFLIQRRRKITTTCRPNLGNRAPQKAGPRARKKITTTNRRKEAVVVEEEQDNRRRRKRLARKRKMKKRTIRTRRARIR